MNFFVTVSAFMYLSSICSVAHAMEHFNQPQKPRAVTASMPKSKTSTDAAGASRRLTTPESSPITRQVSSSSAQSVSYADPKTKAQNALSCENADDFEHAVEQISDEGEKVLILKYAILLGVSNPALIEKIMKFIGRLEDRETKQKLCVMLKDSRKNKQ